MNGKERENVTAIELLAAAKEARKNAYAPYSGFFVGAALLAADGEVYGGCNVESVSFTPTCCAERTALCKAVSEGKREFSAIAVVGGGRDGKPGFCPPCGVCRQMLSEFCGRDFRVILSSGDGEGEEVKVFTLGELLPEAFGTEKPFGTEKKR